MISSLELLSILSTADSYARFKPYLKEHLVGREAWSIIKDMEEWYEDHSTISWENFGMWFLMVKHPMFRPEKADLYRTIFTKLQDFEPDQALVDQLTAHLIERDYASRIAEASLAIAEGSQGYSMEDISSLYKRFEEEVDAAGDFEANRVRLTDEEILAEFEKKDGLNWRLPELNTAVGPLKKGDFIMVASYPGSGKTTFFASEATHFVQQLPEDRPVLWFNNEERGSKVMSRLVLAYSGMTEEEVKRDPVKYLEYKQLVQDRVVYKDQSLWYTHEIERECKHYNPGLIIIDQLWKVHGFTKRTDSEFLRMGMVFQWGRELAKTYCPVLVAHQGDSTTNNQKFIELNQLYMSKVAVQGEMDVVITLGRDDTDPGWTANDIRGLYTPKNKLTGRESYRAEIILDAPAARFRSITD